MTPEQRKAQRDKREAAKAVCDECHVTGGHAANCSKVAPEGGAGNLDDAVEQAKILNLDPIPLTIGGEPVRLYPLPANEQCRLSFSFMAQLNGGASELGVIVDYEKLEPGKQFSTLVVRYARVLTERAALKALFAHFLARSEHEPSADFEDDDESLALRAKLIDKTMKPGELVTAIGKVLIENEVFSASPKAPAQPKASATT